MFAESAAWKKFVIFIFCAIFCLLFCGAIALLIIKIGGMDPTEVNALKIVQLFGSAGIFVVAPILTVLLTEKEPASFFPFKMVDPRIFTLAMISMIVMLPCISQIGIWNEQMQLPEFLQGIENWMRGEEDEAKRLTLLFLREQTIPNLLSNLFIIALIPAIGEELMFRGYIQQKIEKRFNKPHLAVWVAAFIFSAIHLQFYGFFPRLLMGALLGYLFLYSRSMITNICCHFMNNAMVIFLAYLSSPEKALEAEMAEGGTSTGTVTMGVISLLATVAIVYLIKEKSNKWVGKYWINV